MHPLLLPPSRHVPFPFCSLLLLLLTSPFILLPISAHFVDPTVAAFPIGPSSSSVSHSVRLPSPSTLTCTFTHSTSPPTLDVSTKPSRFNMADWLSSMTDRGECVTGSANYWSYEVCMLAGVRQSKGAESYGLGKERVVKEMNLVFRGGDECITPTFKGPRETTVNLACDPSSSSPHLSSINEPSTCHYDITVTTTAVCGDTRFPTVTAGVSSEDSQSEDFFMEMTHLHGHDSHSSLSLAPASSHGVEALCAVYSLEPRAKKSELNFVEWELRIDRHEREEVGVEVDHGGWGEEEEGHAARRAEAPLYVARHPGRRVMGEDEVEVELNEDSHVIRSTEEFNGQLAYLKLYA
jgi:hypothetical protein